MPKSTPFDTLIGTSWVGWGVKIGVDILCGLGGSELEKIEKFLKIKVANKPVGGIDPSYPRGLVKERVSSEIS